MSELKFPNINSVIISCRLTNDPDLRYTQAGKAVCSASAAINRNYKKGDEWISDTSYVKIIVWGVPGERLAEQATKGSPILVEGYLQVRDWESKDKKGKSVEIVASKANILTKQPNSTVTPTSFA